MLSYFHNLKKRKKNDIRKKTNKIYKIWSVFNLKKKKKKKERKGRNSRRNLAVCPEQPPVGGGRN